MPGSGMPGGYGSRSPGGYQGGFPGAGQAQPPLASPPADAPSSETEAFGLAPYR
jgi:hypothetical protein